MSMLMWYSVNMNKQKHEHRLEHGHEHGHGHGHRQEHGQVHTVQVTYILVSLIRNGNFKLVLGHSCRLESTVL